MIVLLYLIFAFTNNKIKFSNGRNMFYFKLSCLASVLNEEDIENSFNQYEFNKENRIMSTSDINDINNSNETEFTKFSSVSSKPKSKYYSSFPQTFKEDSIESNTQGSSSLPLNLSSKDYPDISKLNINCDFITDTSMDVDLFAPDQPKSADLFKDAETELNDYKESIFELTVLEKMESEFKQNIDRILKLYDFLDKFDAIKYNEANNLYNQIFYQCVFVADGKFIIPEGYNSNGCKNYYDRILFEIISKHKSLNKD